MQTKRIARLVALVGPLLPLLHACGHGHNTIIVDGIEVYEKYWNRAVSELQPRASAEMQCPSQELKFQLIGRDGRQPNEVAITGCQKRALYVRQVIHVAGGWGAAAATGSWMLSSASWAMPAPQAVAPAAAPAAPPPSYPAGAPAEPAP